MESKIVIFNDFRGLPHNNSIEIGLIIRNNDIDTPYTIQNETKLNL